MFNLSAQPATFDHMNTFAEKHGKETVNGLALKLTTAVPMATLNQFAQGLLGAVYQKDGLRFPDLAPLSWKRELVGAQVSIDGTDLLGRRYLQFDLATVGKFLLEPLNGGSVKVTMQIKVKPDPDQVAVLYQLQHTEVELTIDPAKAEDKPAGDERQPALEGVEG